MDIDIGFENFVAVVLTLGNNAVLYCFVIFTEKLQFEQDVVQDALQTDGKHFASDIIYVALCR